MCDLRLVTLRSASVLLLAAIVPATGDAQQSPAAPRISEKTGLAISSWKNGGIDHHNQLWLIRAEMEGKRDGIVMFATEIGRVPEVIDAVAKLGADIMARYDE